MKKIKDIRVIRYNIWGWWDSMASLTNMARGWTKPLVPTVFPAASPTIQAYQRQSLNFVYGQLSVSLLDRPGLDLGETPWTIQLWPYKETGGSNQSHSWGQDVGLNWWFCISRISNLQKVLDLKYNESNLFYVFNTLKCSVTIIFSKELMCILCNNCHIQCKYHYFILLQSHLCFTSKILNSFQFQW